MSPFSDLSGRGGVIAQGRWHHAGRPVVYLTDSPSSAMLETLVHLEIDPEDLPNTFQLLQVDLPDHVSEQRVGTLPTGWREDQEMTRNIGDEWLDGGESLILEVPSAIMPHTQNFLLNPQHPEAAEACVKAERYPFDTRLLKGALKR